MKKSKIVIPILLAIIFFIGLITIANASTGFDDPAAPKIMNTMENVYTILEQVAITGDVSEYTKVFVDTPDFQNDDATREFVSQVLGSDAVKGMGLLTAMQAKGIANIKGDQLLKAALDKAKSENRHLTSGELQQLIKENYGQLPGIKIQSGEHAKLSYEKLQIFGNKAILVYDDGQAQQEATLVKLNDQWFVSNIKALWVHF